MSKIDEALYGKKPAPVGPKHTRKVAIRVYCNRTRQMFEADIPVGEPAGTDAEATADAHAKLEIMLRKIGVAPDDPPEIHEAEPDEGDSLSRGDSDGDPSEGGDREAG